MDFETLAVTETNGVAHIELTRAEKANAINMVMWKELKSAFDWLSNSSARIGVLSGRGNHFCAGIDLGMFAEINAKVANLAEGRKQERLLEIIVELQQTISAVESCKKPILAAIHGACLGAGVDLVTACDMRYATQEAKFSVKEIDLAIVADLGTLQRLPRLIGDGYARELAFTGREFDGKQAHDMNLVNKIFSDKDSLIKYSMEMAVNIAGKSPLAIRGIKDTLNYSRDHTVAEGLSYVAAKNAAILFSADFNEAVSALQQNRNTKFED